MQVKQEPTVPVTPDSRKRRCLFSSPLAADSSHSSPLPVVSPELLQAADNCKEEPVEDARYHPVSPISFITELESGRAEVSKDHFFRIRDPAFRKLTYAELMAPASHSAKNFYFQHLLEQHQLTTYRIAG